MWYFSTAIPNCVPQAITVSIVTVELRLLNVSLPGNPERFERSWWRDQAATAGAVWRLLNSGPQAEPWVSGKTGGRHAGYHCGWIVSPAASWGGACCHGEGNAAGTSHWGQAASIGSGVLPCFPVCMLCCSGGINPLEARGWGNCGSRDAAWSACFCFVRVRNVQPYNEAPFRNCRHCRATYILCTIWCSKRNNSCIHSPRSPRSSSRSLEVAIVCQAACVLKIDFPHPDLCTQLVGDGWIEAHDQGDKFNIGGCGQHMRAQVAHFAQITNSFRNYTEEIGSTGECSECRKFGIYWY